MRLFLTGGTGLLGQHILDALRSRGHEVIALVRSDTGSAAMRARGADFLKGDVASSDTWKAVPACDGIVHAAAVVGGKHSWEEYVRVNVEGTRHASDQAAARGVPLIHISSVAVYGRVTPGAVITEETPWGQQGEQDFYAKSKRQAEQVVWRAMEHGLKAAIFRPCVIYGEGDRLVFPGIVRAIRRGIVPLIGQGDRPLPLVYAGNVAEAISLALEQPASYGRAYNVTNDGDISARTLAGLVAHELGRSIRFVPFPAKAATLLARYADWVLHRLPVARYPGSLSGAVRFWRGGNAYTSSRLETTLGWHPVVPHAVAIPRCVRQLIASSAKGWK